MLDYLRNQINKNNKIVMIIICKNEEDVIAENIRFHKIMGIEHFVVMDNGSTDKTREILQSFQDLNIVNLIIFDNPSQKFEKKKWIWQLVKFAQKNLGATHVIPCDADEFWFTQNLDIKSHIKTDDVNIIVNRKNFVISDEIFNHNGDYLLEKYRVDYPLCYDKQAELKSDNLSLLFANIGPKVLVSPSGLISLNAGFHRAKHLLQHKKRKETNLIVYHYPIRSYEQFFKNVENRSLILKNTPNASMGNHYKRWAKLYFSGKLENEYERILITKEDIKGLLKVGAITKDETISNLRKSNYF